MRCPRRSPRSARRTAWTTAAPAPPNTPAPPTARSTASKTTKRSPPSAALPATPPNATTRRRRRKQKLSATDCADNTDKARKLKWCGVPARAMQTVCEARRGIHKALYPRYPRYPRKSVARKRFSVRAEALVEEAVHHPVGAPGGARVVDAARRPVGRFQGEAVDGAAEVDEGPVG